MHLGCKYMGYFLITNYTAEKYFLIEELKGFEYNLKLKNES